MKVVIDPNNKQQREMAINAVSKTIGKVIRDNCDMNRAFHIEDMEVIESVMKRQEEIIEEQEERIAIMSEGGWHDASKRPPKEGRYLVWGLHEFTPDHCNMPNAYWQTRIAQWSNTTGWDTKVKYWQELPKPPKRGEDPS